MEGGNGLLKCPEKSNLLAFLEGRLGREEIERYATHIEQCGECLSLLDRLDQQQRNERQATQLFSSGYSAVPGRKISEESAKTTQAWDVIAQSRLFSQSELASFRSQCDELLGPECDLTSAVHWLVGNQKLTEHQGDEILAGRAGALVLGDYCLETPLGMGGMGSVYRARHARLGKIVAIKVLSGHSTNNPASVARFQREMQAVGKLHHPHIVEALDARVENGTHFLSMELVNGRDVESVATTAENSAEGGLLLISDCCEIIRQAALGLQHVFESRLVHRDMKPSNLMLTRDGIVKILDLGLALLETEHEGGLTSTGHVMGTMNYIAPEQIVSTHHVDIRADLYSLGCTLYRLLAGQTPFPHPEFDSAVRKMHAHCHLEPQPLSGFRDDLPTGLLQLINELLAKDPGNRLATPLEVAERIGPYCQGCDLNGLLADPSSRVAHTRAEAFVRTPRFFDGAHFRSRRQWIFLAAGLLMLFVIAAFAISLSEMLRGLGVEPVSTDVSPAPVKITGPSAPLVGPKTNDATRAFRFDEPATFDEWLVEHEIITVKQDGTAMFANIHDAIVALKPGQVVEVLDRGPYRENVWIEDIADDCGLISRVKTVIEAQNWQADPEYPAEGLGHFFHSNAPFRIHGLAFVDREKNDSGEWKRGSLVHLKGQATCMEDCFVDVSNLASSQVNRIYAIKLTPYKAKSHALRDSIVFGSVATFATDSSCLFSRNLIRTTKNDFASVCGGPKCDFVFAHNIFESTVGQGIMLGQSNESNAKSPACILFQNNDIYTTNTAFSFAIYSPSDKVQLTRNIISEKRVLQKTIDVQGKELMNNNWILTQNSIGDFRSSDEKQIPLSLTEFVATPEFLSLDPLDRNYMRIRQDPRFVIGNSTEYMGALAPGPAPAEGDWFTDMLEYWREEIRESLQMENQPAHGK